MAKGSNGRRTARGSVPRTIDLTAQPVEAKPAADVPPAEPVAFEVFAERKAEPVADSNAGEAGAPVPEMAADEAAMAGPEPASPSEPQPVREPAPRMRAGPILAAALAGGIAGLVFLGILGATGILRDIAQLGAPPVEDTVSPRLDALEARLAATPDHQNAIDALAARLDAAEKALAERAADPASGGDDDRLMELTAQVEALETRLASAEAGVGRTQDGAPATDPAQSAAATAAFEERLKSLSTANDGQDRSLEAIEARIAALEDKVDSGAAQRSETDAREDAARRMASDALVSAYRRGEPYADLLGSLAGVAGVSPDLPALQAPAAEGVATDAELAAQFQGLAGKIATADAPRPDGLVDRFLANARSLVEARPAGPVEGSGPAAIVSRIEAQLATGSLGPALAEWQALPPAGKAVSQEWATRLEARIAADKALGDLLSALGRPAAVPGQ